MESNVFLIASPLQALNALEACQEFGIAPNDSVMICCDSAAEINDRQTRKILQEAGWGKFHTVPYFGATLRAWFGRMRRLDEIARTLPLCERLFLADYGFDLARHFGHRLLPRTTVLLDDGSATLAIAATRRNPGMPKYFLNPPFTTTRKLRLKRLLGMRDTIADHVTYFTVYNFEPESGSTRIINKYTRLRAESSLDVDGSTLFFLGTSAGEQYGVSDDEYLRVLSRALDYLGHVPNRFYLPHRHESRPRLDRLARELSFSVKQFDAPIEYGLCRLSDRIPGIIAGFASSAFDNLHTLFRDLIRLKVFEMPELSNHEKLYSDYCSYYRSQYKAPQFEIVSSY